MENMPYREGLTLQVRPVETAEVTSSDWRNGLPVLTGERVTLRELRTEDAASLFALLTTEEVARFISPPPSTVEGFERFIAWTLRQRTAGTYACFAVTLKGFDTAIGIFQVRADASWIRDRRVGLRHRVGVLGHGRVPGRRRAACSSSRSTRLNVHRLEARAAVQNGRGNGALIKMGAVQEAILRKSFAKNGRTYDQVLFAILESDWRAGRRTDVRSFRALVH